MVPTRKLCRICNKTLSKDEKPNEVICYTRDGTKSAWRYKRKCRRCSIQENVTYFNRGKNRYLDVTEALEAKWILSTEDTAIEIELLKDFELELLIGYLTFRSKCDIYNSKFGYNSIEFPLPTGSKRKRLLYYETFFFNFPPIYSFENFETIRVHFF